MTVADSLRALAAFLDAHPSIDVSDQNITILKYCTTREALADVARLGSWRKEYTASWFELHKDFGNGITIQAYTDRGQVCRQVVKGTRIVPAQPEREEPIVEWICDDASPLLETATVE